MAPKLYQRSPNGMRFVPGGMNLRKPADLLEEGEYAFLQNVRAYLQGRLTGRATQLDALGTLSGAVQSIRRLNDTTPEGPPDGFTRIAVDSAGTLHAGGTISATGLSGAPVSLLPFRPNTSVQPWMYVGDASENVTLTASDFACFGMVKVRSDGLAYKTGIAEPQTAPDVSIATTTTTGTDALPATTRPWSNEGGANADYNYGDTGNGTSPVIISTPVVGSSVAVTVTGTATVNGASVGAGASGPTSADYPGAFIPHTSVVVAAFTDANGNIVAAGAVPNLASIGASATLTVPANAIQLQIGIDSKGGTFSANTGSFNLTYTVSASSVATAVSTLGEVTAYYWGDSPHSGQVATYVWKNPNDSGFGIPRTTGNAAGSVTSNSWNFDSDPEDETVPVQWETLDSDGTVAGSVVLFSPALESQGYQDFNACICGSLFIPVAGAYTFTVKSKDQVMVGIGGGVTSSASSQKGANGQTISVVNSLPLVYVSAINSEGGAITASFTVTFPGPGAYQVELDWDYWYHAGRVLVMTCSPTPGAAAAVIPPISSGARTGVQYWGVYRSSATGAMSNPSPASTLEATPVLGNQVSLAFSPDPQVDKIDYYRQDSGLPNPTYVATGPNTNPPTPITDELTDLGAANNQELEFDNFEPFPSIDLPRAGKLNVSGGVLTWVSGDKFNIRWLPGTVILIGSPTQLAYSLYARPTSTTSMMIPGVPDGEGLTYNIAEPLLAAQPLPSLWGPTDNTAYMFACGDALRPGTLYWIKGNNPDSAPDTNQLEVTSPSEPLQNGVIVNGIGMVFSTERAWLTYPTFTSALATVSGVTGSAFSLTESITDRGLYIRTCLCVAGGKTVFFRAKDGIYASPGGSGSESLTDSTLFNLFPHEGFTQGAMSVGAFTVYPPNDTLPQQLSYADGYLYFDYYDSSTVPAPRTLVYDVAARGWSVDAYQYPVTVHALEEGPQGTLTGCGDGSIRALGEGTEVATSVIATGAVNAGDDRAGKTLGDLYLKALIESSSPATLALYTARYGTVLAGFAPSALSGLGTLAPYIVDFRDGQGQPVDDIALALSWPTGSGNVMELWSPDWTSLPETTQDRPTDWDNLGSAGNKFIQGLLLECDTNGQPKAFSVQRSDDLATFTPNESPVTCNGRNTLAVTFTPPFLAHLVRRVSTDGIPWRSGPDDGWRMEWIFKPYPEATVIWQTEGISHGRGFQHVYQVNLAYRAPAPVTFTITYDSMLSVVVVFPATGGGLDPVKTLMKLPPAKGKIISYTVSSTQPFYLWQEELEVWVKSWGDPGEFQIVQPFGGSDRQGAEV